MIYLDNGATSFRKPKKVYCAVQRAMETCANTGRGGYPAAMAASRTVFRCREEAASLFSCQPEQVVFTMNCTHALNIAINTMVKPNMKVAITGFEHNAVSRPLYAMGAEVLIAGTRLFDWDHTLQAFEDALKKGAGAAVFTHCSNVFGYILPIAQMADLCKQYGVPFVIDAAQSAGVLPLDFESLGADFIAMPGHKGLLGPQGTGILLCGRVPKPLLYGGTGSLSYLQTMPDFLPDIGEAGTLNVPGIAGLCAGIEYIKGVGIHTIEQKEHREAQRCIAGMKGMGLRVFHGEHQSGTVSFLPNCDCEVFAQRLAERGVAVRAGLHCAPIAHKSAGTLETGTVRISFGYDANIGQSVNFLKILENLM